MSSESVARRHPRTVYGLTLALASLAPHLLTAEVGAPEREGGSLAAKILGPSACSECHVEEFEVWRTSTHEAGSRVLTRDPKAREIAKTLGVRRMMGEERCARCHFTLQEIDQRPKHLAGVSCESCHGAAKDWLELHDDFGPGGSSAAEESEAHRLERTLACEEMGMVRPSETHLIAEACFTCHVVDDEELIAAGHPTGAGFELLSWSQGEMRHNFLRAGKKQNALADLPHRRLMYVIGQMLELKHAARSLTKVENSGPLVEPMSERIKRAMGRLEAISAAADIVEVREVLTAAGALELVPGTDTAALVEAIGVSAMKLCQRKAGVELQGIDPLLPDEDSYKGRPSR